MIEKLTITDLQNGSFDTEHGHGYIEIDHTSGYSGFYSSTTGEYENNYDSVVLKVSCRIVAGPSTGDKIRQLTVGESTEITLTDEHDFRADPVAIVTLRCKITLDRVYKAGYKWMADLTLDIDDKVENKEKPRYYNESPSDVQQNSSFLSENTKVAIAIIIGIILLITLLKALNILPS